MSTSSSNQLNRRDFIKTVSAGISSLMATLLGIPAIGYLLSPAVESEVDEDALIFLGLCETYPIGVPTRFEFTQTKVNGWERTAINYGLYVVRKNDIEVRAFSDICTHLGCRVTWQDDHQHYVSPCHDGHFDIVGNVISGPPPRPLDEFVTKIEGDRLFVQMPAFRRS